MRFVLRQITRRAAGGDIVRSRVLAAKEPVIGRGSDCDIQLQDLAVNLQHAVLKEIGPGRFSVEGRGEAEFEADGVFVNYTEFFLAKPPKLGFADHLITLQPGEQAGDIVVTVAPREILATSQRRKDSGFTLNSALFSQRRAAWIGLAAILFFCLALPVGQFFLTHNQAKITDNSAARQWSSGPLSPGHHFLEQNCETCHQQAFVAVRDTACLACHRADLDRMASLHLASDMREAGSPFPPRPARDHAPMDRLWRAAPPASGFGQRVSDWFSHSFDHPNNRCASCHTEHVGTGNVPASSKPPAVTKEELARNDCAGCHADMSKRLPDSKIPNVADWGHHPDFRPLITVSFTQGRPRLERMAMSARPSENPGIKFSHQEHLSASSGVTRMADELGSRVGYGAPLTCDNCHHAEAGGFQPIEMTRDCAACHTLGFAQSSAELKMLPHGHPDQVVAALRTYYESQTNTDSRGEFTRRPGEGAAPSTPSVAQRVADGVRQAFAPGGTCYECHTVIPPGDPASLAFGIAPVHLMDRYLPDGAFDHDVPEHRRNAQGALICDSCHKAKDSARATDLLLPRIADCGACHGKSKNQTQTAAGADCAECHGFHDTGSPMPIPRQTLARATRE